MKYPFFEFENRLLTHACQYAAGSRWCMTVTCLRFEWFGLQVIAGVLLCSTGVKCPFLPFHHAFLTGKAKAVPARRSTNTRLLAAFFFPASSGVSKTRPELRHICPFRRRMRNPSVFTSQLRTEVPWTYELEIILSGRECVRTRMYGEQHCVPKPCIRWDPNRPNGTSSTEALLLDFFDRSGTTY